MGKIGVTGYSATVIVDKRKAEYINDALAREPENDKDVCYMSQYEACYETVPFPYGYKMTIECDGVEFDENADSNRPITKAILYKDEKEVISSNSEHRYFGEWTLEDSDISFTIIIKEES